MLPGKIARMALITQFRAMMRIATWNLERPDPADTVRNQARLEKIREIDAELWILTETHEVIDLSGRSFLFCPWAIGRVYDPEPLVKIPVSECG